MPNELWINTWVTDIEKSKKFYLKLGFVLKAQPLDTRDIVQFVVADTNAIINLLDEPGFALLTGERTIDTKAASEMVLIIDVESRGEVDEFSERVVKARGTVIIAPKDIEGGYELLFADPDGHCWKVLYRQLKPLIKSYFDGLDQ